MGAGASVDHHHAGNADHAAIKASGTDLFSAYHAIEAKLKKSTSEHLQETSIHALALRQLSQNLKNQESLEKSKIKMLKSRSMPYNLRFKPDDAKVVTAVKFSEDHDDLNHHDLEVVGRENDLGLSPAKPPHDRKEEIINKSKQKKKPALFLHVSSAHSQSDLVHGDHKDESAPPGRYQPPAGHANAHPAAGESRVSPHGTLYMGNLKVAENGIIVDVPQPAAADSAANFEHIKRNFIQDHGYVAEVSPSGQHSWKIHRNKQGDVIDPSPQQQQQSSDSTPMLPSLTKGDFIEIATLGSGASGVVTEALHVPSLTIVALKMLPVYNNEKRLQVSRELRVLHQNLADMRLTDDSLLDGDGDDESDRRPNNNHSSNNNNNNNSDERSEASAVSTSSCRNVLSLYNAFLDPKSGMINLVVEYMDGGSLEDLVRAGGCRDERVLADIAIQTLSGLAFLHRNKNVHRDIKPANILCSSSGVIKVADFGISRALDKTNTFAHSFVGTVSYMSPERITAESYSFPADIWSLGLTLLAVAKGRFPIRLNHNSESNKKKKSVDEHDDEDGSSRRDLDRTNSSVAAGGGGSPEIIGGPGGYWAMIQAICDDEPPSPGPSFSPAFNDFINNCLRKDASLRLTARQLLGSPWVTANTNSNHKDGGCIPAAASSSGRDSTASASTNYSLSPRSNHPHNHGLSIIAASPSVSSHEGAAGTPSGSRHGSVATPLTQRLTVAAISRNTSVETPSYRPREPSIPDASAAATDEETLNLLTMLGEDSEEGRAMQAIRFQHLCLVLEQIARKAQLVDGVLLDNEAIAIQEEELDEDDAADDKLFMRSGGGKTPAGHHNRNPFATDTSLDSDIGDMLDLKLSSDAEAGAKAAGSRSPRLDFPALSLPLDSQAKHTSSILKHSQSDADHHGGHGHELHSQPSILASARSVHFVDEPGQGHDRHNQLQPSFSSSSSSLLTGAPAAVGPQGLRSRLNLKALALHVEDSGEADNDENSPLPQKQNQAKAALNEDDEEEGRGGIAAQLPRPSSYFVSTAAQAKDDDRGNHSNDDAKTAAANSVIASVADYRRMLPRLDDRGISKWSHLATQLNLPLRIVIIAAKAHLSGLVDSE